jgi:hypothetical protein
MKRVWLKQLVEAPAGFFRLKAPIPKSILARLKCPPVTVCRKTSPEEVSLGLSELVKDEEGRRVLRGYFETGNATPEEKG